MMITEACRVPVDDPNTHLELTMIHEVMILDNSGPDLGFILYTSGLKLIIISSLIASLIIPLGIGIMFSILFFLLIIIILSIMIGFVESIFARLRLTHVPQFIFLMTSIAFIILSTIVLVINGGLK